MKRILWTWPLAVIVALCLSVALLRRDANVTSGTIHPGNPLPSQSEVSPEPRVVPGLSASATLTLRLDSSAWELRAMLREGTRDERIASMLLMMLQDRASGDEEFRDEILAQLDSPDTTVSMAATEFAQMYLRSEGALLRGTKLIPSTRACAALDYYATRGDYSLSFRLGNEVTRHTVGVLELAVVLAENDASEMVLSRFSAIYDTLYEKGDKRACLLLGQFLAQHQRWVAYELALDCLNSSESSTVAIGADLVSRRGAPDVAARLKAAYLRQADHSTAREMILSAMTRLQAGTARETVLELMTREWDGARQDQMLRILEETGMTKDGLRALLKGRAEDGTGGMNLAVASLLYKVGDRSCLPRVRSDLRQRIVAEGESSKSVTQAIRILGESRDADAVPDLGNLLGEAKTEGLRDSIAKALGRIGTAEAQAWLDSRGK